MGGEQIPRSAEYAPSGTVRDDPPCGSSCDTGSSCAAGTARVHSGMAESEVLGMHNTTTDILFKRIEVLFMENEIISGRVNEMASTLDEAVTQVNSMKETFDTYKTGVDTAVAGLKTQVAELQAQINAGSTPDLTGLSAALDGFQNDLNSSPPPAV